MTRQTVTWVACFCVLFIILPLSYFESTASFFILFIFSKSAVILLPFSVSASSLWEPNMGELDLYEDRSLIDVQET